LANGQRELAGGEMIHQPAHAGRSPNTFRNLPLSRLLPAIALLLVSGWLTAAEPTVRSVNVRGLQVGGTTTITIDGDELGKPPRFFSPLAKPPQLLLPFPAKQTLKPGRTEKRAEFEVTLGDNITPGLYHLRVVTDGGASLPVVVGVDRLPQKPFGPTIAALPIALHGAVTGASIAETTFTGKAGEKVTVEVEAQRIGSKLRPVVHLYSSKRLQLAWAWGTLALDDDARLEATLPADGTYTITLHDAEYAGQGPGHFRLKVGRLEYVDQVFPPVVGKGARQIELLGSEITKMDLPAAKSNVLLLPWPKPGNWSGPRPWVRVSSRPELLEPSEAGKVLELPAAPVAVSGKLGTPHEEDRFKIAVQPKTKLRFEVFAERLGSPVDASLVIRNEAGGVLAQAEDSPKTLDPVLEYTVPDKVTSLIVGVVDSSGRGSPRAIYRLVVDPVKGEGLGDFTLTTPVPRLTLPANGRAVVPVYLDRRGYSGKIDINAENLPAGVKLEGNSIAADADGALVTLSAGAITEPGISSWTGHATDGYTVDVVLKGHPLERLQPWLASELSVAPTKLKAADFTVDWKGLPADAGLSPAGKLALPVTVKRLDPAAPVRLVLLTSQAPPLVNGQLDANRAIRLEKPVELAAKASDSEVTLIVPAELPADSYQIAIQAELLSPDKQRVLATAVTPVRNFVVKLPVAIKVDVPKIAASLDAKKPAMLEVKGTVQRLHGFAGDIAVSLTGVPLGVSVPAPVNVKAGETAFTVKVALPTTTPAGEVKLKLSASCAPDAKQPNVRVKGRDIDVVLNVIAAPPPAK
jgi:hypothetical protein